VVDGARSATYRELGERVHALARALSALGIGAGERLALLELNSQAFIETTFAAAGIGAIVVPLNYRLSPGEIGAILRDAGARAVVARAAWAPLLRAALGEGTPVDTVVWIDGPASSVEPARVKSYEALLGLHAGPFEAWAVDPDEVAQLYYTSGTTGRPKGVKLTHRNVCLHALGAVAELKLDERDVWGHIAPMFHLADAWATFAITWVGGRHVMVPSFAPEAALRAIQDGRVTITNLIPTMLNLMVRHPLATELDTSSLRLLLSGGAPIAPELVQKIDEIFRCDYVQTYGMTETSPYLTLSLLSRRLAARPREEQMAYRAKTGRPFITVELAVVDEHGEPVTPDGRQVGEIWVRGETVTPGYWNLPEETRQAFCRGWLRTGDLAVVDGEGYVNIVDRKKDMIISGGENVYCIEVENVLAQHPALLEAAAFGLPDDTLGERVAAAVVLREAASVSAEQIVSFCRERLAGFKIPRQVVFLRELPRTGSGKIHKRALRQSFGGRLGS